VNWWLINVGLTCRFFKKHVLNLLQQQSEIDKGYHLSITKCTDTSPNFLLNYHHLFFIYLFITFSSHFQHIFITFSSHFHHIFITFSFHFHPEFREATVRYSLESATVPLDEVSLSLILCDCSKKLDHFTIKLLMKWSGFLDQPW